MCGFVGCVLDGDDIFPDLDTWSDSIRHRGPDQVGQARVGTFGIGTRRLSIQDLSPLGNQPMESERYILGFNGEIYNHYEIRKQLAGEGFDEFISHSDTETILWSMEIWGINKTLRQLNGMYALAVWDKKREELTLARDPMGIKPLYYMQQSERLYFASELKAIRPYTSSELSLEGLALYLYFGFVPAPHTLIEGLQKLKAGSAITFAHNKSNEYTIQPEAWSRPQSLATSRAEQIKQVRQAVENAVCRQLISDVPVGLFLSGGVDSSVIAAAASTAHTELSSFSLRPGSINGDPGAQRDADLAKGFAHQLGFKHFEVPISPKTFVDEIESFLRLADEPTAELYAIAEVILSRKARAEGVPVVLTGHGGDELFLGYPTYQSILRGNYYNAVPLLGNVMGIAARFPWLSTDLRNNYRGAASVWRKSPQTRYIVISGVHFSLSEVAEISGISQKRLQDVIVSVVVDTQTRVNNLPNNHKLDNTDLFARLDLQLMVPEHYNMRLDRASMSASVEARVPLQDLELVGFITQFSYKDLMKGGLKGLFKAAFMDVLPEEVVRRSKQTFQAPMRSWISSELAPWVEAQLKGSEFGKLPIISGPFSTQRAYQVWSLAMLEGWRKAYKLSYS